MLSPSLPPPKNPVHVLGDLLQLFIHFVYDKTHQFSVYQSMSFD